MDELIDVVDAQDHVVGTMPRSRVRETPINYRVAHVFVFDTKGRLLLQRPAAGKASAFRWGSSVAGHVQSGEGYEAAAAREFREELGVKAPPLSHVGTTWLDDGGRRKFIGVFTAACEGPFSPDPAEVAGLDFYRVSDVRRLLREEPGTFSTTFERVFRLIDTLERWP